MNRIEKYYVQDLESLDGFNVIAVFGEGFRDLVEDKLPLLYTYLLFKKAYLFKMLFHTVENTEVRSHEERHGRQTLASVEYSRQMAVEQ